MSNDLGAAALCWVSAAGVLSGAVSLLVFERYTGNGELRRTANRIVAHLLEIHLFASEPLVVLRAQRDLIVEHVHIVKQLARPFLLLFLPYLVLLASLELFFGYAPLRAGETALVTAHFRTQWMQATLISPPGIRVDAPPVMIPSDRQLVWRVKAQHSQTGELQVSTPAGSIAKSISASNGISFVSPQRSASLLKALLHPGEWPFSNPAIDSIAIAYPAAAIFGANWLVWFSFSSCVGAVLLALFR